MPKEQGNVGLKLLLAVTGVVISLVLLSTVFFKWSFDGVGPILTPKFSFEEFGQKLPSHLDWLLPFMALTAAVIPLRALQWQRTLNVKVPFKERYHLVAIGAFTNNAIPGKLGDVMRAFLMARTQRLPFVESLGSILVCKLLEFAALVLLVLAAFLGPFTEALSGFSSTLRVVLPVALGLVLLVVLLAHYAGPLSHALERRERLPKLRVFLSEVSSGLGTARSFRGMAVALVFSVGPVLAPALAYGLGLWGLGIQGGLWAGPVVLAAIALGQSAIGVPAGMGIYYFVTSWAARTLGASADEAAAYAALTHLATILTQLGVGAVSVHLRKLKWSELKRRTVRARQVLHETEDELEQAPA